MVGEGANGVGKTLGGLNLAGLGVTVTAVRRKGSRDVDPGPDTRVQEGDVLVMLGTQEQLARAEMRVLQG
jgi:CPA2 family monovalent cation:H+ antiporter-2